MIEITDLVQNIIQGIDNSIIVNSFENLSGNYFRLYTCNTKWARIGKTIFIYSGQVGYGMEIKDVAEDAYITIEYGYANPTFDNCALSNPFFISGTKISTNNEWSRVSADLLSKTPLIWLYQNYTEETYGLENSLERTITMNIAFLDETNPQFLTNKEHIDNAVKPCGRLKDEFIKSINKNLIYKTLKSFNTKTFSRFGVESESGVIQNILDADLSGVVLNITLDKFKEPCKC